MKRRDFLKAIGLGGAALLPWPGNDPCAGAGRKKRPNLVFVFPDEFRRHAMGFMKQDPVMTPNLDRMAAAGMVFTHAISNRPICSPYRAMLMTGQYPESNRVLWNCNSATRKWDNALNEKSRCFSDVLRDAGYSAGYIGKWHLDSPERPYVEPPRRDGTTWDTYTRPERRHNFDFWYAYGVYDLHLTPHYWTTYAKKDEKKEVREWSTKHETDVAIEYIRNRDAQHRKPDEPFALFVSFNPPHFPFELVPKKYVDMYEGKTHKDLLNRPNVDLTLNRRNTQTAKKQVKNYFAAVTGVDEQFGRILDCLKQEGLEEDTIVVFTSDHGEMMGSHNMMGKGSWHEESVGIPLLVRWPGKVTPGRDDLLMGVPDMMPSLLGLMGLGHRVPESVEGKDYSAVMLGKPMARPDSAVYLNYASFLQVESPSDRAIQGERGVRTHQYTYVVKRSRDRREHEILHDNWEDPYQLRNIADEHPELKAQLKAKLDQWLARLNDPWLTADRDTTTPS